MAERDEATERAGRAEAVAATASAERDTYWCESEIARAEASARLRTALGRTCARAHTVERTHPTWS